MSARGLICLFAKPPVPGRVKTRLAAQLGSTRAAALAQAFLQDTWAMATSVTWARTILATTEGAPSDFGLPGLPDLWFQGDGDLGKRMERILRRGLTEAEFVIAIGADSPGLPSRLLDRAREALTEAEAVLGPSDDGGFYLAGLRHCPEGLFDDLPWSAATTFAATRMRLESRGWSVRILESWFDVDLPEDLDRLRRAIERGVLYAPATSELLSPAGGAPCG